jgi:pimeloyl-ACP methyl ester carboxylesterase
MKKTIFVIPGRPHSADMPEYRALASLAKGKGYTVHVVPIHWKYRVMSQYVEEFETFFARHKGEHNTVLGFSYGAMIAYISAASLRPDVLLLCSLSPFFAEDFKTNRPEWEQVFKARMKRRYADFLKISADTIARKLGKYPHTHVLYGELEREIYPELVRRCERTARALSVQPVVVSNTGHDMSAKNYQDCIKELL